MVSTTKNFDVYGKTAELDDSVIDVIAKRLESRGKHPLFLEMLHDYLDFIEIDNTDKVLDLGCGTGFVSREVAKRSNFKGNVFGIDISPQLIKQALIEAESDGLSSIATFDVGDSLGLNLRNDSFDVVIAHTLISHVPDPETLIGEMRRLVKPGGYVVIFDGDYASLTFSNPDPQKGKETDELITGAIVTQPRILRQLPLMLTKAQLEIVKAFSYVVSDIGQAEFWLSGVESMRKILPTANAMTVEEANNWADDRNRESETGTFFASSNYYSYITRK